MSEVTNMPEVSLQRVARYSHSSLQLYRLCPTRWKFHYQDHLEPTGFQSRHDLDYGGAYADGQAVLRRGGSIAEAQAAFALAYPAASYPSELPLRSQGKTFSNGLSALAAYQTRWAEDDAYHEVLEVEERNPATDPYSLKLDLVTRDKRDGQIYAWDSKTTGSNLDNNFWARFDPNSQVRFYTDHVNSKYGSCGGFYIDVTRFYRYKKAYTPRSGPEKGIQKPAGEYHDFARMIFNPNPDCIQLERDNSAYWIGRIEADKLSGEWGYNDQACHQYGRECEYFKLCSAGYTFPRDEELVLGYYRQQCPKVLDAGRCQLDLGHKEDHDPTLPVVEDYVVETEEAEENAICD